MQWYHHHPSYLSSQLAPFQFVMKIVDLTREAQDTLSTAMIHSTAINIQIEMIKLISFGSLSPLVEWPEDGQCWFVTQALFTTWQFCFLFSCFSLIKDGFAHDFVPNNTRPLPLVFLNFITLFGLRLTFKSISSLLSSSPGALLWHSDNNDGTAYMRPLQKQSFYTMYTKRIKFIVPGNSIGMINACLILHDPMLICTASSVCCLCT